MNNHEANLQTSVVEKCQHLLYVSHTMLNRTKLNSMRDTSLSGNFDKENFFATKEARGDLDTIKKIYILISILKIFRRNQLFVIHMRSNHFTSNDKEKIESFC